LLLELVSPDLDYRQSIVRQQIDVLQLQLHRQAARRETVGDSAILEQQLAESLAEYRGLASQRARLFIHASQAGQIRDLATDLTAGRWIGVDLPLLRVVETGNGRIRGYLREDYLHRISAGDPGRFIADDPAWPVIPVQVQSIDPTGAASLQLEALASDRSGPIAVRRDEQHRPQPIQAYYGVRLSVAPSAELPMQPLRGIVVAEGATESIVGGMWRHIAALGVRESGF
jgi:putative peptide zinc metalloprotease protein